jgi:hypothetical protein
MRKLPAATPRSNLFTVAVHVVARATRGAGAWLSVLALSACLASAMALALTSARQEPEPLGATTEITPEWPLTLNHVRGASRAKGPFRPHKTLTDRTYPMGFRMARMPGRPERFNSPIGHQ